MPVLPSARYILLACLRMQTGAARTICPICTEQFPAGCFYITVKEIPAVQLALADREMGARGLEQLARPPPVFAVRQNRQGSSYSANSLLFRPPKKMPPETSIPNGNNSPITSLPAGKNWQNQNRMHPTKMPLPWGFLPVSHLRNWKLAAKPFYHKGAFFPPALHVLLSL